MRKVQLRSAGRMALLAMIPLVLAGCSRASTLSPEGPIAAANRTILLNSLVIMLAIVVPTIIATLAFAWWFREGNAKARYQPHFVYSGRIEMIVWSIPILVILFLGGLIWVGTHQLNPDQPIKSNVPPLEVQVVSLDWKWLFIYPQQGVASVNALVVPVGVPVHFRLTSASVMNTFFVPRLGSMIYTMNGMETELYLQADRASTMYGRSAMFSGDGFPDMHFAVNAVPAAGFANWVQQARGTGPVLNAQGYAALYPQTLKVAPFTYRAVQPGIFEAIVSQKIKPQPGPRQGRGGEPGISPRTPESK